MVFYRPSPNGGRPLKLVESDFHILKKVPNIFMAVVNEKYNPNRVIDGAR
jgi:hypothetical protein